MEIESNKSLSDDLYVDKSDNQKNYMKELQDCIEKKNPQMIEIVRTEEKIDSTLKILLNFKLNKPEEYKQIIVCCQRSQDTNQYFKKVAELAEKYPEIKEKLLIVKVSNKKKLCIEQSRLEKYDDEIFCKYKRKVDTNKCKLYEGYLEILKNQALNNKKGLYDQDILVQEGRTNGVCPYFTQTSLIKLADIIICEHKNIFNDEDKQKDIYQFIPMSSLSNKGTFLFIDQSQYLYEDVQTFNSFNIEQQVLQQAVNKCRQLKQIIYEKSGLVKQSELIKNNKVTDFFKKDYNELMSKLEKQMLKPSNDKQNNEAPEKEKPQQFPAYVKHPIILIEFIQNVALELNQLFENHFTKKKNDLDKQTDFNNAHHANAPILKNDKIPQEDLLNIKNLYPMKIKLRLVVDELLSYLFKHIYPENQERDESFQSLYIICDFLYFFNTYYQSSDFPLKIFFQDHPEYLKEAIYYPILTCTPAQIKNFSKRIFDTCQNFILTSDCILQKNQMRTTTILGLQKLAKQNFFPRFDLEERVKFNCKPMFFTKWNDQSTFQSQKIENSPLQLRNYVNIINRVSEFTPDGIVVYLPNIAVFFRFIKEKVGDILSKRPVYFESPFSPEKTKEAFNYYKTNCDNGQGSFFFCVANGWASRHLEFQDHCARTVLILGYPKRQEFYQYILSHDKKIYGLEEEEFYTLDSMTKVTQCIKSVYTHTTDYCTIILADTKLRADSDYLPTWANQNLKGQDELTVDDLFQEILLNQRAMGKLYG